MNLSSLQQPKTSCRSSLLSLSPVLLNTAQINYTSEGVAFRAVGQFAAQKGPYVSLRIKKFVRRGGGKQQVFRFSVDKIRAAVLKSVVVLWSLY